MLVDYDVFMNVPRLDAKDLKSVQLLHRAEAVDFRLKAGSAAVDRGIALAKITDGFAGHRLPISARSKRASQCRTMVRVPDAHRYSHVARTDLQVSSPARMIKLVVNGVIAGVIVVAVSEVARRSPRVAEVILAVPMVVFAVYAVMYLRAPDLAPISAMARQMLVLVPLSLTFFVPLAFADRLHLTFWPAFAIGLALVTAAVTTYLWFTR